MHPYVYCGIIYNSQDRRSNLSVHIDEWTKKMWYIYTMEYCLAIKNEILPFATICMELEGIMLSDINQTEKEKYHMILLVFGI